jgi:hypothetical protein
MYIRIRTFKTISFVEVFFIFDKNRLVVAQNVPRFDNRCTRITDTIMLVDSKAPTSCNLRTRANLVSDGLWCVESDWVAKGGYPGTRFPPVQTKTKIPYLSTLFGLPIQPPMDPSSFAGVLRAVSQATNTLLQQPIVVYHGTAKDTAKHILKEGLKPSYGMFGTAVYLGTFWKAYRFATLTQDYAARPGAIFRVLAFWTQCICRNWKSPACFCPACGGKPTFADHLETWKKSAQVVWIYPEERDGKFIVRNEEHACADDTLLLLDSVAYATRSADHHNPWDRSLVVD